MPVLILDNDALLKLCAYDLIDEALAALRATYDDIYVLPTAKYSLLPTNSRLKRCKDEATALRLEHVLSQINTIDDTLVDTNLLDTLIGFPGIDPGEALLIAYACQQDGAILLTGDKRAIASLASADELKPVADLVAGRICVMEVLFKSLINVDFTNTQEMVRGRPWVDKALNNIFGVKNAASLQSVEEGLESYINHLEQHTGSLVVKTLT